MKFEYTKLPADEAYTLRDKFIDTFVNTSCETYIKYIRDRKADDVVDGMGFLVSFLWCCLDRTNVRRVDFYSTVKHLQKMKNERVFVMWDIRPLKVIYPEWCRVREPDYLRNFRSDDVISIAPEELCEILLRDHHIEAHRIGDVWLQFLPEDLYVFDETFTWLMAFTHEEYTTHNEKRLCFSNIGEIEPLVLEGQTL